jgi:FdhD protein
VAQQEEPLRSNTTTERILAVRGDQQLERADRLATEEPMEIQVRGTGQEAERVAVTMRTPGNDFELAVGFLFTEGLIHSRDEVESVRYCETELPEQRYNVVRSADAPVRPGTFQRNFYATSSCGVRKASIDASRWNAPIARADRRPVSDRQPTRRLRAAQRVFEQTGGLHASGLFDTGGKLLSLREDVGRHNALDKVVGEALLQGTLPLSEHVLQVSGRTSFEIVQKAAMAGIPIVCAVSAPSSLAVASAKRLGMTLVGFVRGDRFNVYAHPERIDLGS